MNIYAFGAVFRPLKLGDFAFEKCIVKPVCWINIQEKLLSYFKYDLLWGQNFFIQTRRKPCRNDRTSFNKSIKQ